MLGWHISVFRQANGGSAPARADSERGARVAVWQAGLWGLARFNDLVKVGQAIDLGGNGYPLWYTAQAEHLIPRIAGGLPEARSTWAAGPEDILTESWVGGTEVATDDCRPDEWLLVEAWDES